MEKLFCAWALFAVLLIGLARVLTRRKGKPMTHHHTRPHGSHTPPAHLSGDYRLPLRSNPVAHRQEADKPPQPTRRSIGQAAYFRWLDEGRPADDGVERWLAVERQLSAEIGAMVQYLL